MSGSIPEWVSVVLDEAYISIGGVHLTPFTVHQLIMLISLSYCCRISNVLLCTLVNFVLDCCTGTEVIASRVVSLVLIEELICVKLK